MIQKFLKISILVFAVSFLIFPFVASAVDYLPLVPCGLSEGNAQRLKDEGKGDPNIDYSRTCTKCDSFRLVKNIIDFVLIGLVPIIAAVLFIAAGLIIVLAGARPEWISTGKQIFWNTFIGLVVIFSAWLVTNTFIKLLGPDQIKTTWYKYTCTQTAGQTTITLPGGISLPPGTACSDPQGLAQFFNTAFPEQNAPELDTLISCIKSNLPGRNLGEESSFDKSHEVCNYTRGNRVCGSCSHAVNSCHYGGSNGNQGALAVDFGNEDIGDMIIGVAVQQCGAKNARCEDSNGNLVSCLSSSATHVHINSRSCDRN